MVKVNVLKYIIDTILKKGRDVRQVLTIGIFEDEDHDIEFDIKSKKLMNDLQTIAEDEGFILSGDGVWVEISLDDGYNGFTMFGNYWRDDDRTVDGDVFFHVKKDGVIHAVDFD